MFKKIYILAVLVALTATTISAQSTAGPIQITSVNDSTNVTAGDNFSYVFTQGETINVQGAYGSIGSAKAVWVTYDVFAPDWSGTVYSALQPVANDTIGTVDGTINFDYVLPADAAYFGEYDDATDPNDIKVAFYILQVRVAYDPINDTFWNLFIEVQQDPNGTKRTLPALRSLEVYPNPATDAIVVNTDDNSSEKNIQVYDLTGKLVLQQTMTSNNLDISSLNNGFHIIRVEQNGKVGGQKVLIQK